MKKFEMTVQSINRTFIDKLYALCDYHLLENYPRNSRHLYDTHMIWNSGFLNKNELKNLAASVAKDRQQAGRNNLSCYIGQKPHEIISEIIFNDVFLRDYESITSHLIFDNITYSQCIETLTLIGDSNILPKLVDDYCV